MRYMNHEPFDLNGESDPVIRRKLMPKPFVLRVLVTLAGAAAGLYVAFIVPGQGWFYVGPFVGMAAIYAAWKAIVSFGRANGGTKQEIRKVE